jgi:hypothetical protein
MCPRYSIPEERAAKNIRIQETIQAPRLDSLYMYILERGISVGGRSISWPDLYTIYYNHV